METFENNLRGSVERQQREYLVDLRESHKMKVRTQKIKINLGGCASLRRGLKRGTEKQERSQER